MKRFLKTTLYFAAIAIAVLLCAYIYLLPEHSAQDNIELAQAIFCRNAAKSARTDLIQRAIDTAKNPYYLSDMYSSLALASELKGDMKGRNNALLKISHQKFMSDYFFQSALLKIGSEKFSDVDKSKDECVKAIAKVPAGARKSAVLFAYAIKLRQISLSEEANSYLKAAADSFKRENNPAVRRASAKIIAEMAISYKAPDVFIFGISNMTHDEDKLFLMCRGASEPSFESSLRAFSKAKNLSGNERALAQQIGLLLSSSADLRNENLGKYEFGMKYFAVGTRFKWGVKNWNKYYYPIGCAHAHFLGKDKLRDYFANEATSKNFVDGMKFNGMNYCRYLTAGLANAGMRKRALETLLSRKSAADSASILRSNAEILSADPKFLDELFAQTAKLKQRIE